jgi:hypothetical protein
MTQAAPTPLALDELAPFLRDADVSFVGNAYPEKGSRTTTRLALFADDALTVPRLDKRVVVAATDDDHPAVPLCHDALGADTSRAFAPLPEGSAARKSLLGLLGPDWRSGPEPEIDEAFDWRYFRTVPSDQRCALLQGDEWLVLEHLDPEHPLLKTQLPGAKAVLRVLLPGAVGGPLPLGARADMLLVDGAQRCCSVVWRGSFSTPETMRLQDIRMWTGVELPGTASMPWPSGIGQLPPSLAPEAAAKSEGRVALAAKKVATERAPQPLTHQWPAAGPPRGAPALPPQGPVARPAMLATSRAAAPPAVADDPFGSTVSLTNRDQLLAAAAPVVPFRGQHGAPPPAASTVPGSSARSAKATSKPVEVPLRDLESTVSMADAVTAPPPPVATPGHGSPTADAPGRESTAPIPLDRVTAALTESPLPFRPTQTAEGATKPQEPVPAVPPPPVSPWVKPEGSGRNQKR